MESPISNENKTKHSFGRNYQTATSQNLCNETKGTCFLKTKNEKEALGGNLVHFFGESIEVVDGVVDGVNYVDRGNCGVPVAGDDEN